MEIDRTQKFLLTNWDDFDGEIHQGTTGTATWKILMIGDIRLRMVEYSKNYLADHWCDKGHIIYCIEGEMITDLLDGRKFILKKGMTYQVGDFADAHRSYSENGAKIFIVD